MARIPPDNHKSLDQVLDYKNPGIDKHLGEIAEHIVGWEEKLAALLNLTQVEIDDIEHIRNRQLQRSVIS